MATILALEASAACCSVALCHGESQYYRIDCSPRSHSQQILAMIDAVLSDAGISVSELDTIAYGQGPGAFTGLRIAVSVAQGLAFTAKIPVIGVSSLACLAHQAYAQGWCQLGETVLVSTDAKMDEVYWAHWRVLEGSCELLGAENLSAAADVNIMVDTAIAAGDGLPLIRQQQQLSLALSDCHPDLQADAKAVLALAKTQWRLGKTTSPSAAEPVYIRGNGAWKTKAEQAQHRQQIQRDAAAQ